MRSRTQAVGGQGSTPEATPSLRSGQALFRQAQAGCRDSLNRLMARHEGLVYAVVRRYGFGDLTIAAALHLGRIGLWRAIAHYTPERGAAFSTYGERFHFGITSARSALRPGRAKPGVPSRK